MAPRKTATKSSKVSTRSKKSVAVKSDTTFETPMSETTSQSMPRSRRPVLFIVGGLLVLGALLYFGQRYLVAASVNGEMISRLALYSELEKQYGAQTLDGMITKVLVKQEARNRNINVAQEDLDNEIKKIEERFSSQGQSLDEVLSSQGYSRQELLEQVELQLLVEKMVADKVQVTDEDIAKYLEDNKQFLPTGTPEETQKEDARESLRQEKINQEGQTLIQELKSKAKINSSIPSAQQQ